MPLRPKKHTDSEIVAINELKLFTGWIKSVNLLVTWFICFEINIVNIFFVLKLHKNVNEKFRVHTVSHQYARVPSCSRVGDDSAVRVLPYIYKLLDIYSKPV